MTGNTQSKLFYIAVGNNIKKYRDIRNYSLQTLGEKVGLTKKTIQRYENGEIKIDMNRLADIAEALDVDTAKLLEGTQSFLGVDLGELDTINLPIYGRISCGKGSLAFEDIEGYEATPKDWARGGEFFYLRAKGESMSGARIHDGYLLLIRKQDDVENGEIAAVMINGEDAVLKRVVKNDGQIILVSENPEYPLIFCPPDEVQIIGKLKKVIFDI